MVHLFLPSGKTFTFAGWVESDNESTLVIAYQAQSDEKWAKAVIQKRAIVGYSVKED